MCDQTEVQYLPGEVVWVKLRALWWPGLVQDYDSLPEEITCSLRKRPIATVKFFQEDSYEYVHKLDLIYHYNCSRKHEFIKKGLDLCRKKSADRPTTMDFFPMDIVTAEERTNGDPNILQDKAFRPDEKPKYTSLFGEQKKFGKKKGKEDSPLKDKVARRKKLTSKLQAMGWLSRGITANIIYPSPDTPRIITHRRFLNKVRNPDAKSDYEFRIMEQKCEDDTSCLMDKEYECVICGYKTRRLNVIVLHFNSTHSNRTKNIFPSPSILKAGSLRNPLLKLKENRKSEGGKLSFFSKRRASLKNKVEKLKKEESEVESSEEEPPKPQPVKKEKGKPGRKRKVKPEEKIEEETPDNSKKPKVLDSLLADWDEEDGDLNLNEDLDHDKSQLDDKDEGGEDEDNEAAQNESGDKSSASPDNSSASKSKEVFEFDPDEDDSIDFDLTPNVKGFGRRIPRVIESSKDKKGKNDSKKPSKDKSEKKGKDEDIGDIESLLAETSVPSLPAVPKSSTFSMDIEDDLDSKVDESSCKSVLKEQNDGIEESAKISDDKRSKNSEPEVDLAVDSKSPPQEQEQSSTAKVTVQLIPDIASAGSNINVRERLTGNDASPSESKSSSGDHTYVSGNSGRKRRRHLLPLEKNDSPGGISAVDTDDDFMVEESPRKNKQPFLPQVEGSNVVIKPTPRRGRPPKKGKGAKGAKTLMMSSPQLSSKSPPPLLKSKSPSPRTSSMSPPPVPSPKSPPPHRSPKSPVAEQTPKSPPHRQSSKSPTLSPRQGQQGPKSPIHVVMSPGGPKSPQPLQSPKSPKSPQPYQSPSQQGPKSPLGVQGPKSPQDFQGPKSPQAPQGQKSPQGPKSPQASQGPKSPQVLLGPKSPQGLQSPKSPTPTLLSPKGLKTPTLFTPDAKTIRSPPRSLMKSPSGEVQAGSKSPVKSPLPSPTSTQATLISTTSPAKSTGSKMVLQTSPVKVSASLKKISTPGAVVVQSKPDLQPEACGIGKIIASTPTAIASGSPGTVKTIKVAVSGSSPMVVTKPGSSPRKLMIVQGKGGQTQKMLLPAEASQQLLSNFGSGKKIMVITKGSAGSPGKLVLTSQHQKILASGGKVTTSAGQTITSKGTVLSSVTKLVAAKPSTSTSVSSGVELGSEPPALIKTDGKKTYKIITTPQSKGGNILLNTSSGQILVPVSSIGASGSGVTTLSGSKQFILPVGAKQMKFLNTAGGTGQKVILQMKSSTAKAGLAVSPKSVQPIVPKTVVQSISPKTIQTISPKLVQTISSKTIQSVTPKTVLPITPKTSQPMKVTKIATTVQPVPQLTPIGSPKTPRFKQVKTPVAKPAKTPTQPKSPRKGVTLAKTIAPAGVATSSTTSTPVLLPATSPQKRNTGIVPNPNLKPIAPHSVTTKKMSLAAKPAPVETPSVSTVPGTVQVMTSVVPGLDQIQTNLVSSVESSVAMTLPTSTQQLVAVPTEDGGQVMYLIDNSSLLGLDSANQGNLGNIILAFDNMGQPTASSASDFTFSTPSSGQDILAEALANTDLQSEAGSELSLDTSGLLSSHSSSMYPPTLSHGVLETSLTLNQPIMTPLEDLSGVSTLQPPPSTSATTSVELPTITVPDITISTSSYSSLPIPSATIQSTVFSEAQNVPTFTATTSADGSVFLEAPTDGESFLTAESVYEQTSEGASMPLLDG